MYDDNFEYVCNVYIGIDSPNEKVISLSKDIVNPCEIDWDVLDNAFVMYAEDDYPIVGFHGRTENEKLADLGVIWLDS